MNLPDLILLMFSIVSIIYFIALSIVVFVYLWKEHKFKKELKKELEKEEIKQKRNDIT